MASIQEQLLRFYHYVNDDISDPRMTSLPMMSSPWPVFTILGIYLYLVLSLGPRLMRDRKPFKLDRVIQVYNVMQICFNLWLIKRAAEVGFFTSFSWKCQPVDFSNDPNAVAAAYLVYKYFVIKLVDLMDTAFFVLRKKNNQISFLHVFHHGGMLLVAYGGTKYVPGGHSSFLGVVNCAVHSVMYSYYLVTSLYPQHKRHLWWKKHITQMQLTQFLLMGVHQGQLFFRECDYPTIVYVTLTLLITLISFLFYDYYRNEYGLKRSDKIHKNQ